MFNNLKKEITIMKNFRNYICLFLMVIGINVSALAEDQTWTYTFKTPDAVSNNSITVNNATWTFATTPGYGSPAISSGNSNSNYGLKFGNGGSDYFGSVTFSTDYFTTCKVKSVTIKLLNNSGDNGTLTVTQDTKLIGTKSLSGASQQWKELIANTNSGDGGKLSITYSFSNAFYVNSITVVYEKSTTPSVVTLSEAGVSRTLEGSYVLGDMCELPTTSTQQCGSKVFVGWSSKQITTPTDRPTESFYPIGTAVQLNKTEETFYAVYADAEGTEKIWEVTEIDQLTEGQGYATYDGEHTVGDYIYQSSNVWESGGKIQFKSNQGYIYNKTEMPNISKIEITTDVTAWIVKEGNAENPSTGTQLNIQHGDGKQTYVFSTKTRYFYIAEKSGSASDVFSIKVTFGVAYSNYVTSTFTLTYAAGEGTGDAPAKVEGAAQGTKINLSAPAGLKKEGSVFQGWKSNVTDDNTLWKAGQEYTMPAQDVIMTAQWLAVTNYQTYCPRTVTFDLNGLLGEAPADIVTKKNLTITDPGDPVTPVGTDFLGWYNLDNDQKWNFETDVVTEDMLLYAKCQSALTISGNVHLTSGKDVQVYTTPATNNMITVSWFGKDEPLATKIRFSYYLNGVKVEKDADSPFRVCYAENYNMVSSNINNEGDNFEQTFAVSYKPTAYNQLDNYTIRVEAVNNTGTETYRTADLAVYGRSLPEQFVMVIKKTTDDKGWYAIPNELASTSDAKAEDMPMPLLVEVNDNTNPTFVKPSENASKALYSTEARYISGNNRGGIRLKSVANDKFMTATKTNHNSFYMPDENSDDNQPFYLTSSDFGAYKVTLNPALYANNIPDRWISMYAGKIAWYNTQTCDVYFLPVITESIEIADEQTKNLSNYGVNENTTIIVHAGGTLNADKVATIGTLQIERKDGKSGQVFETATLTANNAYFDLTLNAQGMKWYDIAVPFTVDRLQGLSLPDGNKIPLNDVLVYDGEARATNGANGSAWQYQDNGDLNPGVGYDIMFASNVTTVRFTKKAEAQLNNEEDGSIIVEEFESQTGSDMDANWNYIANNTLHYVNLGFDDSQNSIVIAQTYNPEDDNYTAYTQDEATYLVGTPFFVQVAAADKVVWNTTEVYDVLRAPAMTMNRVDRFTLEMSANGEMTDRLFVSADENARDEYQIGKDVAKMGVSSTIAQMWINNYNTKLCANEAVLTNGQATYQLGVFIPKDGEYTIAITSAPENATLYLTIDGQVVWNLSESAYVANLTKGTHNEFGLLLIANEKVTPTNINGLKGNNKAQKIFKDYNIYILRNAQMYNTQGVKVQ